jgi:hypothetical protein
MLKKYRESKEDFSKAFSILRKQRNKKSQLIDISISSMVKNSALIRKTIDVDLSQKLINLENFLHNLIVNRRDQDLQQMIIQGTNETLNP